jgi:hypothetical protein
MKAVSARVVFHNTLHILLPMGVVWLLYPGVWLRAWALTMTAWVIDMDHLLANPRFDADRCSIGRHPLHRIPAIVAYAALCVPKATRVLGIGLIAHIACDLIDCGMMRRRQNRQNENRD